MNALRFRELHVRRMPGFRSGGFVVDDLCPGLNLVCGPNASGKTTTARALSALLWPHAAGSTASLLGRWEVDGKEWSIDLDAGRVLHQRAGADAEAPALPPFASRDRYHLSLHELLRDENAGFAEAILRESTGGYDVAAAAADLAFRSTPSQARRETAELKQARQALQDARAREEGLREDEARLRDLRLLREEAQAAADRVELLRCAIAYAEARAEAIVAENELESFPAGIALLSGQESMQLTRLRQQLGEVRAEKRDAERDRAAAERTLAGLPGEGVPDLLLSTLRARLRELQGLDGDIVVRERELHGARARQDEERNALGDAVREDRLAGLNHAGIGRLAEFARRAEEVRGESVALEAQLRLLGSPRAAEDLEAVREMIRLLHRWLRTGGSDAEGAARLRQLSTTGGALLTVAGLLGGVLLHPSLLVLVLAGIMLLFLTWSGHRHPDAREAAQRDLARAGLEAPAGWTEAEVEAHLARLHRRHAEGVLAEKRAEWCRELGSRRKNTIDKSEELGAERARLIERLGVAPDTDEAVLCWLVERISRWQDAARSAAAAAEELRTAEEQRARLLARANAELEPFGSPPATDAAELHGRIEELDRRRQEHATASAALASAADRYISATRRVDELGAGCSEIFERLGLTPDDDAALDEWCRQRESYLASKDRVRLARHERERTERTLAEHPGYELALAEQSREDLERELHEREWSAGELSSLRQEIVQIETRLKDAREGHDVETALTRHAAGLDALGELRDQDCARAVGAALADFLQQETRDRERPQVFHRARELFARITRGRYRLDFAEGDRPAFRALDTTTHRGHALDELSSATRVQLLLAVRVAFVETQEHGVRLPLLLDEALGNSDDQRAQAIIEAVLTLCREGRQVFYFTAQPDEVGKWLAALEAHPEVPHRVVDLARVRKLAGAEPLPPISAVSPPTRQVPAPNGAGYTEYGRALGVAAFDPRAGDAGGIHLWHLLDCPDTLHRLLTLGVERWGQLRTLWELGGAELLGGDASLYPRVEAAARALEMVARAWRVGRGRPVDRQALLDSGAVTDTFLERVCELCAEVEGDAGRLLAGLEAGEVSRFRSDSTERLRDYLEEHRYLDGEAPLTPEEIRVRVLAIAAPDLQEGRLDAADVDRLLVKLPAHLQLSRNGSQSSAS